MLPIERSTIEGDLFDAEELIRKWGKRFQDQQVPMLDKPGSEEQLFEFVGQLATEVLLVSNKLEALAAALRGE